MMVNKADTYGSWFVIIYVSVCLFVCLFVCFKKINLCGWVTSFSVQLKMFEGVLRKKKNGLCCLTLLFCTLGRGRTPNFNEFIHPSFLFFFLLLGVLIIIIYNLYKNNLYFSPLKNHNPRGLKCKKFQCIPVINVPEVSYFSLRLNFLPHN